MSTSSKDIERPFSWTLQQMPTALLAGALSFVPIPFAEAMGLKALLVHTAKGVLREHGTFPAQFAEDVVSAFLQETSKPSRFAPAALGVSALKFVTRKLAIAWSAKEAQEHMGLLIAFAHGLDVALLRSKDRQPAELGQLLRTMVQDVNRAPVVVLATGLQVAFHHRTSLSDAKQSFLESFDTQTTMLREAFASRLD